MQPDDYDELDGSEYEAEEMQYGQFGAPYNRLYFLRGSYKIELVSYLAAANNNIQFSAIISPNDEYDGEIPSIYELYELLDKTFFLEFLIILMANGAINLTDKIDKLIHIDSNGIEKIYVNAEITTSQKYCDFDDTIIVDNRVSDIISAGEIGNNITLLRSCEYNYMYTQMIKYCILKYTIFEGVYSWTDDNVDWYVIYSTLVEPYIKSLIKTSLGLKDEILNTIDDYKEYMTFSIQFGISRDNETLYIEMYLSPNTIYGHKLYYNESARVIDIGATNRFTNQLMESTDIYRIICGNQNKSLLPYNTDIKTFYKTEKCFILNEYDNHLVIPDNHYTTTTSRNVFYGIQNPNIQPFRANIVLDDSKITVTIGYIGFYDVKNHSPNMLNFDDTHITIVGTLIVTCDEVINPDVLSFSLLETPEASIAPLEFYDSICTSLGIRRTTEFVELYPIRALPKYREFMIAIQDVETIDRKSHPSIIDKKEEPIQNQQKRRKWLFSR